MKIDNYFNVIKNFNEVKNSIDLKFYGYVGQGEQISIEALENELNQYEKLDEINIKIHSGGGSVIQGIAIYNLLKNTGATIHVQIIGLAASMGSIIAMVGDTVSIHQNAYLMIHNPYSLAIGDSSELENQAKLLENMRENAIKIYQKHTSLSADQIKDLMDAETWLDGNEAVEKGFATEVIKSVEELPVEAVDAMAKMFITQNVPEQIAAVFNPQIQDKVEIQVKNEVEKPIEKSKKQLDDEIYDQGFYAGIEKQKNDSKMQENINAMVETIDEKIAVIEAKEIEIDALKNENETNINEYEAKIQDYENRLKSLAGGMLQPTEIKDQYKPDFINQW